MTIINIYIEGYGCTLNSADTNILANSIKQYIKDNNINNMNIVSNINNANIVVINTCIVRQETEHKMNSRVNYLKSLNKKIVIAGCMPKGLSKETKELNPDLTIMPLEAHLIGEKIYNYIINNNINNDNINDINSDNNIDHKLKNLKPNNIIMPLPISEGCLGKCNYCIVKLARGDLKSYSEKVILDKVKEYVTNNVKHILITSQDTACYGFDKNTNLPNLLNKIININGEFNLRIGMMHSKNLPYIIDDLIELYKTNKITNFIHLPLQSGDNKILNDMEREYTVEQYIDFVKEFRKKIPNLNYHTDIIVGYPTETEENFNNTIELLKKLKPDGIHGAKYTQRKGTKANNLKQIDTKIRKERMKILDNLRRELSYNSHKKYVGKTLNTLIIKNNEGITDNCKTVKFDKVENNYIGKFKKVKIKKALTFGLYGEILD